MTLQYIPPKMMKIWQTWTYTLFEVVFTQVTASLTNWYLRRFFKILLYIFLYWKKIDLHCCLNLFKKIFNNFCLYISMNKFDSPPPRPHSWPHPTPKDNDLDKLKSTLSEETYTQITAFLGDWWFFHKYSIYIPI